jgi:hypothetical protein
MVELGEGLPRYPFLTWVLKCVTFVNLIFIMNILFCVSNLKTSYKKVFSPNL